MDGLRFRIAFLTLFALGFAVEWILNALNRKEALRHQAAPPSPGVRAIDGGIPGAQVPGGFREVAGSFAKSREYTLERLSFDTFSLFCSAAITVALLFSGVLPWLDRALLRICGDGLNRGVFFLMAVIVIPSLLKLPLSLYSTFRIEGKYGFNTMTWGLYWRDFIKEILVSLALGLPVLYALLFFMRHAGAAWWLWAYGLFLVFQLVMMIFYPIFIAPLFNRFQPLEDGDLKAALLALAARLRFPTADIYVMDGSRRSLHSNAYFTGLGKWRRIVLFDTLLRQMDGRELQSVLAHEIGHYKRKHIYKRMAAQVLILGGLLYLASVALRWPPLYAAFGFDPQTIVNSPVGNPAVGLFLFITVFSSLSILFAPIQNLVSRRHEYEADAFAVQAMGSPEPMGSALIKLSEKNLSNLTPHPWYSAFHYSHPTLRERLKALGLSLT